MLFHETGLFECGSSSTGAGYFRVAAPGVSVGVGDSGMFVGSTVVPGAAVAPSVGIDVACAVRVGVATMIHGVWVGCTWATLPGPGVAVTMMIQGVCVGGGAVDSGVALHPVKTAANRPTRASSRKSFLIVREPPTAILVRYRGFEIPNCLAQCFLYFLAQLGPGRHGLGQFGLAVLHVAQERGLKARYPAKFDVVQKAIGHGKQDHDLVGQVHQRILHLLEHLLNAQAPFQREAN